MRLAPITLAQAKAFIAQHHRHNRPPVGWKFGVGVTNDRGALSGVATAGRPVARRLAWHGLTLEVNRTCTDGTRNANSMLYGAIWRAAKALGYPHCITYIQGDETGASLKAAGWRKTRDLPATTGWDCASRARPADYTSTPRQRWEIGSLPWDGLL